MHICDQPTRALSLIYARLLDNKSNRSYLNKINTEYVCMLQLMKNPYFYYISPMCMLPVVEQLTEPEKPFNQVYYI